MSASAGPATIPGWFHLVDQAMFRALLGTQVSQGMKGDLVELGAYLGRSAVLIGEYLGPGEEFTVCDLFGAEPGDHANDTENEHYYPSLTRQAFESNYLSRHSVLPTIVENDTSVMRELLASESCRLVQVDASHLYEHVVTDLLTARWCLLPDGVVIVDDFRNTHTPGVAAAVWQAVGSGLRPIAITKHKFYGTWGDADGHVRMLRSWLATDPRWSFEVQEVSGAQMLRVSGGAEPSSRARRLMVDLAPPAAWRFAQGTRKWIRQRKDKRLR